MTWSELWKRISAALANVVLVVLVVVLLMVIASRSMEYDNQELPVSIYWNVNTTLTPGSYTVEVFADGYRLGSGRFNMAK